MDIIGHFGHRQGHFGHSGRRRRYRLWSHCGPSPTQRLTGGQPLGGRDGYGGRPFQIVSDLRGMRAVVLRSLRSCMRGGGLQEVEFRLFLRTFCPTRVAWPRLALSWAARCQTNASAVAAPVRSVAPVRNHQSLMSGLDCPRKKPAVTCCVRTFFTWYRDKCRGAEPSGKGAGPLYSSDAAMNTASKWSTGSSAVSRSNTWPLWGTATRERLPVGGAAPT